MGLLYGLAALKLPVCCSTSQYWVFFTALRTPPSLYTARSPTAGPGFRSEKPLTFWLFLSGSHIFRLCVPTPVFPHGPGRLRRARPRPCLAVHARTPPVAEQATAFSPAAVDCPLPMVRPGNQDSSKFLPRLTRGFGMSPQPLIDIARRGGHQCAILGHQPRFRQFARRRLEPHNVTSRSILEIT